MLSRALNARLPPDVRVVSAAEVAPEFPRALRAHGKTYRYRIWNADVLSPFERQYAWHVSGPLDVEAMDAAARLLEGRHDFAAFQAAPGQRAPPNARLAIARHPNDLDTPGADSAARSWRRLIVYEMTGNGFLRHMVRTIVGTLVEIGRGRRPVEWMRDVLDVARPRTRPARPRPPRACSSSASSTGTYNGRDVA